MRESCIKVYLENKKLVEMVNGELETSNNHM